MNIHDINKPVTSKTLNETMAKKYGTKVNIESFTLEQLQDARNKLRTKLSDIETNESFSGLPQNKTYSKNKLFLDILNTAISERADIDEGELPPALKAYQDKNQKTKSTDKPTKANSKPKPKDGKMPMDDNGTPNDKSDDKPAFLKKKTNERTTINRDMRHKMEPYKVGKNGGCAPGYHLEGDMCVPGKPKPKDLKDFPPKKPATGSPGSPGKTKKNESVIKEGTVKAVCKECGDTFGKPTTDCKNDCNDPTQDCWVKESDYMKESKHIDEGKSIINNYFNTLLEGEEDKAEIVMAAKDMVDRLTGWMEDTAEMQSESMLELADAIRDEMGAQQSEAFTNTVKPGLESLYTAMEGTRVALTQGVGMLTGEEQAMGAMGDEPAMEPDMDMEPTIDADEPAMDDDGMGAAAPAAGGEDEAGRAKRESIQRSRRLGTILSSRN